MEVPTSFHNYFLQAYGERWPQLLAALQQKEQPIFRWNKWSSVKPSNALGDLVGCSEWRSLDNRQPQRDEAQLLDGYILDAGSVVAARSLGVESGDRVLDMCAAPGGKSLILAESIGAEGELVANELSFARRERLVKVIQQYVPRESRDNIWVKGSDAVKFGLKEPGTFDKVLLDAPCSGERHLLQNPTELAEWSIKRTERLAARQYSLLAAAYLAVKVGGEILYSTCSISPLENDGVIQQLLKKKKEKVEVIPLTPSYLLPEQTQHGWIYLPDTSTCGPLFFSKIRRLG